MEQKKIIEQTYIYEGMCTFKGYDCLLGEKERMEENNAPLNP